jgi:ankyrin repeat protein
MSLRHTYNARHSRQNKLDAKKEKFRPPFSAAARAGHLQVVRTLLEEGADPNSQYYHDFYYPLHAVVMGTMWRL